MAGQLQFMRRFLRKPGRVGAVAPSSSRLGEMVADWAGIEKADVVVEYGPGTGAMTPCILERLRPGATFIALELDPVLFGEFRRRFPNVNAYCDSVANVGTHLRTHSVEQADCIISGLPWASFDTCYQQELLDSTLRVLAEGGRFSTFAYLMGLLLPAAHAFRRTLGECFSTVTRSPVVWRNLPPAFVYQCVK